ncbi:MAG: sulfatase [Pseudomonadota bacterium]|nr:sulfatase [Pseudomonadota bacterium]MDP1904981.1 sulfatase [Pseudomonadota bacterium]MDP2351114.1 sulfatase [Pseudomonadota bacterium]
MDDSSFFSLAIRASNMAGTVALVFALVLLAKSLVDFSQTGPVRREILARHRAYALLSLVRLTLAVFLLVNLLALPGGLAYLLGLAVFSAPYHPAAAALAMIASFALLSFLQFCRVLHRSPGVIVASSLYAVDRLYPLWERLSPGRLATTSRFLRGIYLAWVAVGAVVLLLHGAVLSVLGIVMLHALALLFYRAFVEESEPAPLEGGRPQSRPNLLMIGSDTLRVDRLGHAGYRRCLTPNLDRLAERGATLTRCYVPCARTAPSLLTMMTGTWPHTHGVRDNFVTDQQATLKLPTLAGLLAESGYRTAALSDWAGSDLGKFDLGFQELDLPGDQWNIRFLMRQGPKDIRLFLSLFLANRIGKFFLEEVYYLGGVPLTRQLGLRARQMLRRLGGDEQPFFLNVFMASTHPPFASEYPYYTMYADPNYRGPSKFAMAKLTDPFEIIRRQGEPRAEFDLEQILDLYDGCVKSFDDEAGRILDYLQASGLAENTLVVVYSDHGMEFFEHETWGQGNSAIGDFSARVPVIMAGPSLPADTRLDGITRSVDLAPTLLELLGLPAVPGMEGVSLVDALRGGAQPNLPAFHETGIWLTRLPGQPDDHLSYPGLLEMLEIPDPNTGTMAIKPEYQNRIIVAKDRMVRCGRWKLVYQPLVEGRLLRLFDLETDPDCRRDLAAARPEITSSLWALLQAWMEKRPAARLVCPDRNGTRDS